MALSLKNALKHAAQDPDFAKEFVGNPAAFKATYNLSDAQIAKIKTISTKDILSHGTGDAAAAAPYYD